VTYRYIDIVAKPAPLAELIGRDMNEVTPRLKEIRREEKLANMAPKMLAALIDAEARLALLVRMDRHKLLDYVAQQRANDVILEALREFE